MEPCSDNINYTTVSHDGRTPLTLQLDDSSTLVYIPRLEGLTDATINELELALAASEATSTPPPEEIGVRSGGGRRQWFVELSDRLLGWPGPRRWQRGSWRLEGDEQLQPVLAVREAVERAVDALPDVPPSRLRERYNTVLVNRYPTGADSIKWHADDEYFYYVGAAGDNSDIVIASVSLGAERFFELRSNPQSVPKAQRRTVRLCLRSGSLLLMAGATQRGWQHALPKDETCESMRINLTFRRVKTSREMAAARLEAATPETTVAAAAHAPAVEQASAAAAPAPAVEQASAAAAPAVAVTDAIAAPVGSEDAGGDESDGSRGVEDEEEAASRSVRAAVATATRHLARVSAREAALPGMATGALLVERRHARAVCAALRAALSAEEERLAATDGANSRSALGAPTAVPGTAGQWLLFPLTSAVAEAMPRLVAGEARGANGGASAAAEEAAPFAQLARAGRLVYYPGVRRHGTFDDLHGLEKEAAAASGAPRAPLPLPRAPRLPAAAGRFTFAELFAGIGGFRLGLEQLGGVCVFASEIHPRAQETYEANFGREGLVGDVTDEYAHRMPPFDVLTAGFPCQPFSQRGEQRGLADARRGQLYTELVRVLRAKRPRAFLFENVPQLALLGGGWRPMDGRSSHAGAVAGETLRTMLEAFEGCGYVTSWRLLNARRWVAQKRLRLYIVGVRSDLPGARHSFRFPCDEACDDACGVACDAACDATGEDACDAAPPPTAAAAVEDSARRGGRLPTLRDVLDDPDAPDVASCALSEEQWARITSATFCAKSNRSARARELVLDDAAPTLISSYRRTISLTTRYVAVERDGTRRRVPRFLTKRECAALMGFPSTFVLPSPRPKTRDAAGFGESEVYKQLGNAVVPPVIAAVAERLLPAAGLVPLRSPGEGGGDAFAAVADDGPTAAGAATAVREVVVAARAASSVEAAAEQAEEADVATRTASIIDGVLALASGAPVPRRLRGRPLVLPAALDEATSAALSSCQLVAMPEGLACARLATLDLSYNAIRALPDAAEAWCSLPALRALNVSHNLLKSLPHALRLATRLATLNARSNQLLQGCGADLALGWERMCAPALAGLASLRLLDVRYNPRVAALDATTLRAALPNAVLEDSPKTSPRSVAATIAEAADAAAAAAAEDGGGASAGADGASVMVLRGAEAGVPIRRGSLLTKCAAGDGDGPSGWPTLLAQLAPLSTPAVLARLHAHFGRGTGNPEVDYAAVGSSRDALLYQLVEAYERAAGLRPPPNAAASADADEPALAGVDSARCRREERYRGAPLPPELCASLLAALRATQWPTQSDRPKVEAASYLVLERPPPPAREEAGAVGAAGMAATRETAGDRRARTKRQRHAALWACVEQWMALCDPSFAFTGVALTKDFRGSPHVDTYDISYQWALSLGDFVGGELCVESAPGEVSVVETRGRAAKVDGRFPHWVLPWRGRERYSIIVYATRGEGTPKGAAVLAVA